MADTKQQFSALFVSYMKDGDSRRLFAFIDAQQLPGLRDCIAVYFDADTSHQQRPRSRAVFVRLVVAGAGKDLDFGLFAEVLMHASNTPWQAHYKELSGGEKHSVDGAIDKKKSRMPSVQRQFVDKFENYMMRKGGVTIDKMIGFLKPLKAAEEQACLALYIEMSPWYEKGNDVESLSVFFLASYYSLQPDETAYAIAYNSKITEDLTVWHTRFNSLGRPQQDALTSRIKDASIANPAKVAGLDPQKQPRLTGDQNQFVQLYRKYVNSKGDRKAVDALQSFLVGRSGEVLAGYVQVYLDDSSQHYGEPPNRESLQIFFGTLSLAIAKSSAYYAYRVKSFIDSPNTIWHKRFAALDPRQYGTPLRLQIDTAIKTKARFIDDLRIAYFVKYQRDPEGAALRNFEPVEVPQVVEQLMSAVADVEVAVGAHDVEGFEKAMSVVSKVLGGQKDLATLWVLVKRCRQRTKLLAQYRHLVHFMGVGLLYIAAVANYPVSHKDGFNADEEALFFDGSEKGDRYFNDFAAQMTAAIWKRAGRPPKLRTPRRSEDPDARPDDTYTAMAKSEGALQVWSDRMRLTLMPLVEAAALRGAVEEAWDKHKKDVEAIRIPASASNMDTTTIQVGQTIGNFYVLWWDDKNRTAYLQVNGFEQVVFEVGWSRLVEIYRDNSFYGVVAENTQHLLELIPFIFEILGYLPDLVSGGLIGVAKSIVFNLAFDKSMQALGIDPMKVQLFLLGASLLIHGAKPKEASGPRGHADVETHMGEAHGTDTRATELHGTEETKAGLDSTHADETVHTGAESKLDTKAPVAAANENRAIAGEARSVAPAPYSDITRKQATKIQEEVQAQANRFAQEVGEVAEERVALIAGADDRSTIGDRAIERTGATNDNIVIAGRRDPATPPPIRKSPVTRPAVHVSKGKINTGAGYQFGDGSAAIQQALNKSVRGGHHVYMYYDADGHLLYVGKSGGVLDHHDWVQRLNNDHLNKPWISEARSVTVYYDLSEQEMWALEEVLIGRDPTDAGGTFYALWNEKPGEYTKLFGEHGLGANASSALKKPRARFPFRADTTPRIR